MNAFLGARWTACARGSLESGVGIDVAKVSFFHLDDIPAADQALGTGCDHPERTQTGDVSKGGLLRRENVQRRSFKPVLKRAGLPDMRFHDLRHTAATLMLLWNINPMIVSEMLGDSKVSITLDLYPQLTRHATMQQVAADAMDAKLVVA